MSCNGQADGSTSVSASGNTAPVTYLWSNGATTASIGNLSAGTYSVTVTETPSCTAVTSVTITQPVVLDVVCSETDVTTNGGSDGTASVTASGGTTPYTYLWSTGATTSSITGVTSGSYSVTVTDGNGCSAQCISNVQEPTCNLNVNIGATTHVSCNGQADGSTSVIATDNIAPVTYLWSNGATTASISNLTAGTYTVTVTETSTCTAVTNVTITQPIVLDVVCSKTDVTTNGGNDGTASVAASGGVSPYTYLWSNGATTASIGNLTAGTYTVTVTDGNGCTNSCSTTVNDGTCLPPLCIPITISKGN